MGGGGSLYAYFYRSPFNCLKSRQNSIYSKQGQYPNFGKILNIEMYSKSLEIYLSIGEKKQSNFNIFLVNTNLIYHALKCTLNKSKIELNMKLFLYYSCIFEEICNETMEQNFLYKQNLIPIIPYFKMYIKHKIIPVHICIFAEICNGTGIGLSIHKY